ncbi:hypothetical protein CARUB_v10018332mg [Capsella rubella]|uniref:Uncharacterized protein n=1 Tax=Capsella rubella TaxID=81985 RepID=R0HIK6_9BRAS|nr:hypothetical protein CARUB_v10018332mg [Capsella rubella]
MEGYETVMFRSKFDSWPASTLLQRQGVNVQGLVKTSSSSKDEPKPYIDGTGSTWPNSELNKQPKMLWITCNFNVCKSDLSSV